MTSLEKEVLEIEDFYKSILNSIINGVWVTNADDVIYYANKGIENIAGILAKQIVGSHILKDFPESTLKYFRPHYLKAKDTLQSVFYDAIPVRTPSGRHSYQSGWLIPRIKEGKYDGIVCTVDDVTERIEAEEKLKESEDQLRKINMELEQRIEERTRELKESEEKFRTISEQSLMGILILQDDMYKYVNQAAANMFGYTVEELLDTPQGGFMNYIHPEDREFVREQATKKQMGMEDVIKKYQYRGLTKSGETIWVQLYSCTITFEGKSADLITSIDFTERKKAQKALKESEEKYRNLVKNAQEGIWALDEYENTIFINQKICEMLGYTRNEMIGKNLHSFIPDSMKELIESNRSRRERGEKETYDLQLVKKDGIIIYTNVKAAPIMDENRNYKGSFAYITDITQRKIAEQELDISEIKYRTIFEEALNPILIIDENGAYLDVNKTACEFLESSKEEILGKVVWDYTPPYILEEQKRTHTPFYARRTLETEYLVNGKIKTLLLNVVPFEVAGKKLLYGIGQNITDRLKAEQNLKESEEKYSNLFQYSNDAIILHDLEGNMIDINQNAIKWLGYTKSEILKINLSQLHPSKDLEISKNALKDIKKNKFINFEIRFKRKNGDLFTADVSSKIIEIDGKTIIQGEIRDITERKMAEQKLKESEEKFRSIFEHAAVGIAQVAPDGSFIKVNQKFCEILKYSQEELLFLSFPEITHPDDLEENIIAKSKLLDGEILSYSTEKRYMCKNGSVVWVNLTAALIRDSSQTPKYFITIIEDISDKKELEEESNKFFNLPLHLLIISGLDGIIKRVNPGWTERLGYEAEELEGKNFLELVHPDDRAATIGEMDKLSKGITTFHFENRYRHKKGHYRTLAWSATSGLGKGVIYAIAHDITERKIAESLIHLQRDIAVRFSLGAGLKDFSRFCVESIIQIEELDYCGIYLVEQSSGDLNLLFYKGISKESTHGLKRIKVNSPRMLLVMEGKPKYANLKRLDILIDNNLQNEGFKTVALIPIKSENEVIGCLNVASRTLNDIPVFIRSTLETIANQIGSIINTINTTMKLKESEEKYRILTKNINDVIWIMDLNFKTTYVSPSVNSMFGYTVEEDMARLITEKFTSESLKKIGEMIKKHITPKNIKDKNYNPVLRIEVDQYHKNGTIIPCEITVNPMRDKSGGAFGLVGITRNIAKRKEAEKKLRESEERYRLLFESSPVGIGIVDFEGNVQTINQAMEKITGYTLEEYKKINLSSTYVDLHDRSKILDVLKATGRVRNYEVHLKRKDESKYHALLNIEIEEIENKKYLITCVQDITELKLAEEKLKELNKLKSELLRRTSHELKTPLVSIKGFSDLLLELHREQLDDYIINTIEEIKRGCIRLETLIGDILKTAELESEKVEINKNEEDLSFLIKLCSIELKGLSNLRNLKIKLNIPDRLIAFFEKEQLHQVISNLLNNAIKYTPPHGNIEIKSEIKDGFMIISIIDSGIGLIEEEKGRIFKQFGKVERFGQGYDVMSEGSGLGLYISKKIIELHGGEIWVESEGRNKGSTFYFSLPIEDKF